MVPYRPMAPSPATPKVTTEQATSTTPKPTYSARTERGPSQLAILEQLEIRGIILITRNRYYKKPTINRLVIGAGYARLLILIILTPIAEEFNTTYQTKTICAYAVVLIYGVGVLGYALYTIYIILKGKHRPGEDEGDGEEVSEEQGMEITDLGVTADTL
ncbi:Protein of unknown function [Pyronema omphalodes CBS 100304]|uniref:Uncharacterized protein n=1 Tax=Pyronema omphalodes (strain CBS 100304) TaxID=1076935 RepID=U4L238_PYROM|nr:Protein of unknown function [Pyronema omphalodes CBS 100304]